ncbi:hypothetical protein PsorP6_003719 [Peronosclerospora sorghi]|uniref:Uncharacterized protein n=1 Tax=Peronosclerospora sorghi TaxID=230839 RepID=A0ACC0VJ96_9STRA|nr:hypothetical protein PsorP6_003719 [Peronosclerospora sorghi]
MDPVLSGSLCFLVLAIAMYLKFIREQPWGDEEIVDHKNSPVDREDDKMPFLHSVSTDGRLKDQQQKRGPGQGRQQFKQQMQTQTQQQALEPHHGYAGFKQTTSSAVSAANVEATAVSGDDYLSKKQPMRRRAHSVTTSTASPSNNVQSAAADGGELAIDQLPTTIYEGASYEESKQPNQSQNSGRNQHRITFDDYDEEMGFLSPTRPNPVKDSLECVSFEAKRDRFYDFESPLPGNHMVNIRDTPDRRLELIKIGGQYCGGDLLESTEMADELLDPKTLKPNMERQFVRDVAPPAQMQLEVARKARIPLFLHSPMYVRTLANPLVEEVRDNSIAEIALEESLVYQGPGNCKAQPAVPEKGAGAADANGNKVRRKRPKLSKAKNDSLHVEFKELQIDEMIGQGAFGTVHCAKWRGTAVAVKILVCQHLTADILEEFVAEVQIMSILRHPNICLLMGACLEPPTRCLVIEYLPRGSLWNVLRQDIVIDSAKQYSFVRDTALGMNYLHSFQPPILHRDLKSPNLLIDSSYALKISDFGLARVRAHFQTMTGNCGTTQWMAPEVLAAEKYTEKADVFSYGVVIWETITRQCPYEGLTQIQAALGVLNNNLRPKVPEKCPFLFKELMTLCWVSDPEERPSFEAILEILNNSTEGSKPLQLLRTPSGMSKR